MPHEIHIAGLPIFEVFTGDLLSRAKAIEAEVGGKLGKLKAGNCLRLGEVIWQLARDWEGRSTEERNRRILDCIRPGNLSIGEFVEIWKTAGGTEELLNRDLADAFSYFLDITPPEDNI